VWTQPQLNTLIKYLSLIALMLSSQVMSGTLKTTSFSLFDTPKYAENFTHSEYTNPDALKGGGITLPGIGTFDTLNPYTLKGISPSNTPGLGMFGIMELNETLMVGTGDYLPSGDEPQSAYCLLCEFIEYPQDKSWVIVTLRSDAMFHNDTPITADDLIYSYNLLQSSAAHPRYKDMYRNITNVEKLSAKQVKFHFNGPNMASLIFRVGELPVLSKTFWSTHTFGESSSIPQPLSGPYKIKSFKFGGHIEFERVRNHWGRNHPIYKGLFNFDTVRFDFFRDMTVALEAFKSGSLDVFYEYVAKDWATGYDFPAARKGLVVKKEIPHKIPSGSQAFILNTRNPLFSDVRVREALGLLFDFEWINKQIFANAYTRSETYYPNSDHAATSLPSAEEVALLSPFKDQLPTALFNRPFGLQKTKGNGSIRPQLRKALTLLKQAGWQIKNNTLINIKTHKPFEFEFTVSQQSFARVLNPYVQNLKKAGIKATIRVIDRSQYKVRLDNKDFDIITYVYPQSLTPSYEQRLYFHSSLAGIKGSRNYAGINNATVDYLVDKITEASSRKELITTTKALDRVLLWNYYMIPHWHLNYHRIAYWDKFAQPDAGPDYILGFNGWWLKQ